MYTTLYKLMAMSAVNGRARMHPVEGAVKVSKV